MRVGVGGANRNLIGGFVGLDGQNRRIVRILAGVDDVNRVIWEPITDSAIYGVSWDKSSNPVLTRTDDAVGMVANAGVDAQVVVNDFDSAQIYREITDVTDTLGNVFVRIPKFYIRKTDEADLKTWQISKFPHPGFYLPWCFWDFTNQQELPCIDVGKYKATLGVGNKLESKSGSLPLTTTTITDMRTYARNNNVDGLQGYQQLDIHVVDVLQTLFYVEFATLDSQSIMCGLTNNGTEPAVNGFSTDIAASSGSITSNTSGEYPCMYRGVESLWGDVFQWVDGLNLDANQAWVAKNADDYATSICAAPYEALSYMNSTETGYIVAMGFDSTLPFAALPVTIGGSDTTYYADRYQQSAPGRIAYFGGCNGAGGFAGISLWYLNYASSSTTRFQTARLVRKALSVDDMFLSNMVVKSGSRTIAFSPTLSPAETEYRANTPSSAAGVTFTPGVANTQLHIYINGTEVPSGTTTATYLLTSGADNIFDVVVYSADMSAHRDYQWIIHRP